MSREIRFRVWNTYHKKMFNVYSIDFKCGLIYCESIDGDTSHTFCFIDCILLQFTGLHDKNKVPIFEGDIIKLDKKWNNDIGVIKMGIENGAWSISIKKHGICSPLLNFMQKSMCCGRDVYYEVIGNIHTHQHLLEE